MKNKELVQLISDLNEKEALKATRHLIEVQVDPYEIFKLCYAGVHEVGKRYQSGEYAISGLIMAGDIMRRASEFLIPLFKTSKVESNRGTLLLGTVAGDIHYIGKNIFKTLVQSHGFRVIDIGEDVTPAKFLTSIIEHNPDIVGLSCLISVAIQSLKDTILFLRENVPDANSPKAYIIGGNVDEIVSKEVHADYWTNDAMDGVQICDSILESGR